MSLKTTLNQIIRERNGGTVSINEIEAFCHKANYKLSNAERRLRPSESPGIERVIKNGAIVGYRYMPSGEGITITSDNFRQLQADGAKIMNGCCPSFGMFKIHSRDCERMSKQVKQTTLI